MGDDITPFIVAKSDQLNADDLVGGPITVRIEAFHITGGPEQPVTLKISGDHKPWKPCKTTMRVLAFLWGTSAQAWVGRTVRLFRDPEVKWAGVEVGGIRISGMSDIKGPQNVTLATSKKAKSVQRIEVIARLEIDGGKDRPVNGSKPGAVSAADLRGQLAVKLTEMGAAPSDLRTYLREQGRELPPVTEWDAGLLDWAIRALNGSGGPKFLDWKRGADLGPTPPDVSFDDEPELPA
jgi:hypothetical protein